MSSTNAAAAGGASRAMMQLLQDVTLKAVLDARDAEADAGGHTRRKLVALKTTDTVGHCLAVLADSNIQSAPVQDPERDGYVGFVDTLDLVVDVLREVTGVKEGSDLHEVMWSSYSQSIAELDDIGHKALQKHVAHAVNLSGADAFRAVSQHGTLAQAAELFAAGKHHRVAVEDDDGRVIGVVSQSDVVRVLSRSIHLMSRDLQALRVSDAGLAASKAGVVTVSAKAPAIQGFFSMMMNRVTAVAVVDAHGHLVGNLSASDVRGLRRTSFGALLRPAAEFTLATDARGGHRAVPVTCRPATRLTTVLLRLGSLRLHRMWCVDDEDTPLSLVSTADICAFVAAGADSDLPAGK